MRLERVPISVRRTLETLQRNSVVLAERARPAVRRLLLHGHASRLAGLFTELVDVVAGLPELDECLGVKPTALSLGLGVSVIGSNAKISVTHFLYPFVVVN